MLSLVQVYGSALAIIAASILLGRAICGAAGTDERWWAAPTVGFAALLVLALASIELPGKAVTAICVEVLALTGAAVFLVVRRLVPVCWADLVVGGIALLGPSIQFLANGRVGLQGVSLDNDTDLHLLWAEALRSSRMEKLWGTGGGYPLGPHSVVASVGTALSTPLDLAFAGLLVAVVPITAMTAAGLLEREALWRRTVIGVMCALTYLVAAYYGEGAFKETIMGGLLLAFVVHLEQVGPRWSASGTSARWWLLVPPLLLMAGAFYTYSYLGLAWYLGTAVIWLVLEAATRPRVARGWISRRHVEAAAPWLAGITTLALLLLVPVAGQAITFFTVFGASPSTAAIPAGVLGNLGGPLSTYEILGVWTSPDFRFAPANAFHAGQLAAVALAINVYGLVWAVRRRHLVIFAAAATCLLIWFYSRHAQSPYVAAKAEVIGAPILMGAALRSLLTARQGSTAARALRLAIAVVFCALAAHSSYQVLRNEPVQAPEATHELAMFSRTVGDSAVLFLGDDDYAGWQLRPAAVGAVSLQVTAISRVSNPTKPWVYGEAVDFDSVPAAELDDFRYVVTSNSPYASQVPGNFRLVSSAKLYDLWERTGPTAPRASIDPTGTPGAILNCRSPAGRKLQTSGGVASVMPTPVVRPGRGLLAGESAVLPVALPPGRWEISIQYTSVFTLRVSGQGQSWTMPAYLGRPGPFFRVGAVTGQGTASPVMLRFSADRPSSLTGVGDLMFASTYNIAATRIPDSRLIIPLSRACGRYVDWYRAP